MADVLHSNKEVKSNFLYPLQNTLFDNGLRTSGGTVSGLRFAVIRF
jgi:hypothetical protein